MIIDKSKINKILLITLSNIGDCIMTVPVVNVLKREFPKTNLSIMVGPRAREIFEGDPKFTEVITYDKSLRFRDKLKLIKILREKKFDLVVDLRQSLFPILSGARYKNSLFLRPPIEIQHKVDSHLWRLTSLGINVDNPQVFLWTSTEDEIFVEKLSKEWAISTFDTIVAICPGARSDVKRWRKEGFAEIGNRLQDEFRINPAPSYPNSMLSCGRGGVKVIILGDTQDAPLVEDIVSRMKHKPIVAVGKTSLRQLIALLRRCKLLITNDSAPMHIADNLKVPTLAIFGPTDPRKYGPRGERDLIIRKDLDCSPCEEAQCRFNHECMELITSEEVFVKAKETLFK